MAGGVMIARQVSNSPYFRAQAVFSDGINPVVESNFFDITTPLETNGDNRFAGFVAPTGSYITELRFLNLNSSAFRNFDDLGFVSAVPEPGAALLTCTGLAFLAARRRR